MADLSFYVGVIGNVISVLMFLSPVSTFIRIVKNRSTEDFDSLPYVCTLLNSSLWTYYGLINDEVLVSTVNGFGVLVEMVYVALFLAFAPHRMKVKTGILVGTLDIGFLGAAILVTRLALEGNLRIGALGMICAALNIIMYGSPLSAMKTVVTTKSVEYMPFLLSFFLFLNGGIWAFYAALHRDIYLLMGIDGGGAVVAVGDDMGGDGMQCSDHPYRNNSSPGGICAFCLQEKLGKLVSSSSSSFIRSSTSSSSPSFRSEQLPTLRLTPCSTAAATSTTAGPLSLSLSSTSNGDVSNGGFRHHNEGCGKGDGSTRRARIPFMLTQKKNSKKAMMASSSSSSGYNHHGVLKRSKSTATPRSGRYLPSDSQDLSPRRRGFWSFLHLSQKKPEKSSRECKSTAQPPAAAAEPAASRVEQQAVVVVVDEADSSPNSSGSNTTSFGRKVSRSRSVGCGSRSFSGDLFERLSTGFGDCTLRRVESQREGRRSTSAARAAGEAMKGRVPCGGLFGGFVITSSSSSSSWVSSAEDGHGAGRAATSGTGPMVNGRRNRNWAWAFASPRRAFGKTTTTTTTVSANTSTAAAPNLAAMPSLLAVRGCPILGE